MLCLICFLEYLILDQKNKTPNHTSKSNNTQLDIPSPIASAHLNNNEKEELYNGTH